MEEEVGGGFSHQRKTHSKALQKEGAEAVGITEQNQGWQAPRGQGKEGGVKKRLISKTQIKKGHSRSCCRFWSLAEV